MEPEVAIYAAITYPIVSSAQTRSNALYVMLQQIILLTQIPQHVNCAFYQIAQHALH